MGNKLTITCIYCSQLKRPRYNDPDCNYCEDCEDEANHFAGIDLFSDLN